MTSAAQVGSTLDRPILGTDLDGDGLVEQASRVIDERNVETVFQPLVHLATGEVVGYEALTRGPVGSAVESPLALLAGARGAGRLAELDWLCAARACAAAQAANLHPSMSIFVNFEPVTLLTACPGDLLGLARRARDQLRVFVEMKEDLLLEDPGRVFEALALVREIGWGVAIDNAALGPPSLGLFPLVEPDVVKLDLGAARQDPAELAAMSDGARLYAEQSGASILVEGVESADDLLLARAVGASFGQGWHLGHPGALEPSPATPRAVFPLRRQPVTDQPASPFELLSEHLPVSTTERRLIQPLSDYIAEQAATNEIPGLLLGSTDGHTTPDPEQLERFAVLIRQAAFTVLLGSDPDGFESAKLHARRLEFQEAADLGCNTIVLGAHYAGALVTRDLGDTGPPEQRRVQYIVTHDRHLVVAAARAFLRSVAPSGLEHRQAA